MNNMRLLLAATLLVGSVNVVNAEVSQEHAAQVKKYATHAVNILPAQLFDRFKETKIDNYPGWAEFLKFLAVREVATAVSFKAEEMSREDNELLQAGINRYCKGSFFMTPRLFIEVKPFDVYLRAETVSAAKTEMLILQLKYLQGYVYIANNDEEWALYKEYYPISRRFDLGYGLSDEEGDFYIRWRTKFENGFYGLRICDAVELERIEAIVKEAVEARFTKA